MHGPSLHKPYGNAEHRDTCAACLCFVSVADVAALSSFERTVKQMLAALKISISAVWEGCSGKFSGEIL